MSEYEDISIALGSSEPESGLPKQDAGSRITRGRFAPTPSGHIHMGNAQTAFVAWLSARSKGGRFIWRLEDLDSPRMKKGTGEQAKRDLDWLGLDWDEGGGRGGPHSPYVQSERSDIYEAALGRLEKADRLFPCGYSRKDLRDIASAPHKPKSNPYPIELRPKDLDSNWFTNFGTKQEGEEKAIRFKVEPGIVHFKDLVFGDIESDVVKNTGDFVLKRRDGIFAYQLAVVVDDIEMEVSEVVRGSDLISSTARQIQLIEALGGKVPQYAHLPLLVNSDGEKLSKRNAALEIRHLSEKGYAPEELIGRFMFGLKQIDRFETMTCLEALSIFDLSKVGVENFKW